MSQTGACDSLEPHREAGGFKPGRLGSALSGQPNLLEVFELGGRLAGSTHVRVTNRAASVARGAAAEAGVSLVTWLGWAVEGRALLEAALREQASRESQVVYRRFEEVDREGYS